MTAVLEKVSGRSLVRPELFDRLVNRIVRDHDIDGATAVRVMDQALVFLTACAANPVAALRPSKTVDLGWHTFILHTRDYAEFCDRVAGRSIHHVPDDETDTPDMAVPSEHGGRAAHTLRAIEATGYAIDHDMWMGGSDCGGCHEDGNCAGSGADGTENTDSRKK